MFEKARIPAVGFSTSGDPTTVYADWLTLHVTWRNATALSRSLPIAPLPPT